MKRFITQKFATFLSNFRTGEVVGLHKDVFNACNSAKQ